MNISKVGLEIILTGIERAGYIDEVVMQHDPPQKKAWKTVGNLNFLLLATMN